MSLTFDRLRLANVARCEQSFYPLDERDLASWLLCVTGELGELAETLNGKRRGVPVDLDLAAVAGELSDVVTYLDLLAARAGIDLGRAVAEKFDVVSERVGSPIRLSEDPAPNDPSAAEAGKA